LYLVENETHTTVRYYWHVDISKANCQ